jgi:hypothetical protein
LAQESDPSVFGFADGAKSVPRVCGLVSVEAAAREIFLQFGVAFLRGTACADAERLTLKPLKELLELGLSRLGQDKAAFRSFAIVNLMKLAKFTDSVEMTEEIDDEEVLGGKHGKNAGPNQSGIFAADGFPVFGFEQLKPDGFDVGAEVESLDIQREWGQFEGAGIKRRLAGCAHTSDSA